MINKICKITLIIAGFYRVLSFVSNTFDGDFGWHLRFGKEAIEGRFQYLDTYTWPHFGLPWTNHEWGGDMLFWLLHSAFGYFSIVILISVAVWGSFLLTLKIFQKRLTVSGLILAIIGIASLKFIICPRLALLALLPLVLLLSTLENLPKTKAYYLWPPLLWLWSALHGSWALGFIVINIYTFGNIAYLIIKNKLPNLAGKESGWTQKTVIASFFWQALSALALLINPYGIKIWTEVGEYFTSGFFKTIITEWVPSYAYPVYILPLIMAASSSVFIIWGWYKKKVTLAQALLFFAIFYAAWKYKRNNVYLVLLCVSILSIVFSMAKEKICLVSKKIATYINITSIIATTAAILLILILAPSLRKNINVWQDRELLSRYPFPFDAVQFLSSEIAGKQTYLFNEFRWGGYLNWTIPEALVYLDGRGTATWMYNDKETRLERYRKIKYQAGGFYELENSPAEYVLLSQYYASYKKPGLVNRIIFGKNGITEAQPADPPQLEKMLRRSPNWQIIFEDNISIIWKRIKSPVLK